MSHCRYLPYDSDIIEFIVKEFTGQDALLVFPTELSAKNTQLKLQRDWSFNNLRCISMEEFKQKFFLSELPQLQDQKRYLAFYISLRESDKEFFHIHNYFESVSLANNFFSLFEELREEQIDAMELPEMFYEQSIETSPWQLKQYERLLEIRSNYQAYLNQQYFTDLIFQTEPELSSELSEYRKVVFVNQVYYTGIEKTLLSMLETSEIEVEIYFLGDKSEFDQTKLHIKDNDYTGYLNPESLHIRSCENEYAMLSAFCQDTSGEIAPEHYVFSGMGDSRAIDVLNPTIFNQPLSITFEQSTIYRFLATVSNLLKGVIRDKDLRLIRINAIMDALNEPSFTANSGYDSIELKEELSRLIEDGFIYLDYDLNRCRRFIKSAKLSEYLTAQLTLLNSFRDVRSPRDLIELLSEKINPQRLLSETELTSSDTMQIFYEGLVNFGTLSEFPLFTHWVELTDGDVNRLPGELLSLLLENLSSRKIKYNTCSSTVCRTRLQYHNFLDTRNIIYKRIAILNLQEGMLPGKRRQPFLFTEVQRRNLGLKTYEQIRSREKYYFFRLLASADDVWLYGLNNSAGEYELSSFIEEILLAFSISLNENDIFKEEGIYNLLLNSLLDSDTAVVKPDRQVSAEFSTIPFEYDDLPVKDGRFFLSFSRLRNLKECPFKYFLENLSNLKLRQRRSEENFTALLFGTFVHNLLSEVVERLNETYKTTTKHQPDWLNHTYIDTNLDNMLNNSKRDYYMMPKAMGKTYFEQIIRPVIANNILAFFSELESEKQILSSSSFNFIPEAKDDSDTIFCKHPFMKVSSGKEEFAVHLIAKSDLRLVSPYEYLIIDYKTGSHHTILDYQLMIYRYVYGYENNLSEEQITPMFWMFKQSRFKELDKPRSLEEWIGEALETVFREGYGIIRLPQYDAENLDDISRYSFTLRNKGAADVE